MASEIGGDAVKGLSKQERWILENASRCLTNTGFFTLGSLRGLLPQDSRSRAVQAASLSRSVRRLVERGLVECWQPRLCHQGNGYLFKTVNNVTDLLPY